MVNGAIETVLWPGAKAEVGADLLLGGIYANKSGYHNSRNNLRAGWPNDYSIQEPIDQLGPGDLGSAIDLTFKSAQGGDYRNIAKYSQRLKEAGVNKDPRAYPLREFQGNIDSDDDVEGWSYFRDHALTTSDKSHLWHIHLSIWRKYINDEAAMRSILSIWNREEEDMPTAKEIAAELAINADFLKAMGKTAAAAVWNADVIPNVWSDLDGPAGKTFQAKNAISYIGSDVLDAIELLKPAEPEPPTP